MVSQSLVYAIIPARSGSKGVPHKNIRPLGGHPLLAWSIAAAVLTQGIDRVLVSTDSEEYANIARCYGAEVPFLRPAAMAGDASGDREFLVHALEWLQAHEGTCPHCMVHLRPTTPLRDPLVLAQALHMFEAAPQATSLRSGHEAAESPAKWFCLHEDGHFGGLMGDTWLNAPRQACPKAYIPDGYVDILRVRCILEAKDMYFPHMLAFVSPHCHEVDTAEDLDYLEYEVAKGHPLALWLDKKMEEGL